MKNFKVRDYLNNHDDEDAWQDIESHDAEDAARDYMEENFPYEDTTGPFEVEVKDSEGVISHWNVEVEFEPRFYASRMKTINLNGRKKVIADRCLSYAQVCWMAFPGSERVQYTVTFMKGYKEPGEKTGEGILVPGEILFIQEGTVINVADTSAA